MKRRDLLSLCLSTPILATAAGMFRPAEARESDKIKMGYNPATGNILGFIAIEKGFASKENLQIDLVPFTNSTDALNALQFGKIDVGVSFGCAAPLTFVTKGADFTIYAGYVSGGMPVYAAANFDYTGIKSFVGKKVAVPRMYTPDIVWRGAMMRAGYDATKDSEVMEFKKPSDVLEAVKSGKADVGIGTNSTYMAAMASGLKVITWTNDLDPMHVCCRCVSNTAWLNANPDVVHRFMKVWIAAEAFLMDNPEECVAINEKYLKLDEKDSRTMLLDTRQVFESDPKLNGVRYMWELLGKLNYAETAGIDVEKHIDAGRYLAALNDLTKAEPGNKHYQMFAERFKKYNA